MEVQIGKRKFTLEQTWGEYKAFLDADNELDLKLLEAQDAKDIRAALAVQAQRRELHEAQLARCLKQIEGKPAEEALDGMDWSEPALLVRKLLNPAAELDAAPFGGTPGSG